jgi:uncharacterized protein (DUF1330 family)
MTAKTAGSVLKRTGHKYPNCIAFDDEPEMIEGKIEYPRTVIVEFPSMTAFRAWYDSPEYQEILPLQERNDLAPVVEGERG